MGVVLELVGLTSFASHKTKFYDETYYTNLPLKFNNFAQLLLKRRKLAELLKYTTKK